jgi:hypothetical protein
VSAAICINSSVDIHELVQLRLAFGGAKFDKLVAMSFYPEIPINIQENHRKSLGNDSISTISSSVAEEIFKQNSANESIENNLKQGPRKVNIDGSKSIQVGEVIYNFYTPSPQNRKQSESRNDFS